MGHHQVDQLYVLQESQKWEKDSLSNLRKELDIQIQEAQRTPNWNKSKRTPAGHVVIKLSRDRACWQQQEKAKKEHKECNTYKEALQIISGDSSAETLRPEGSEMTYSKVLKQKPVNQDYYILQSVLQKWRRN